MGGIFWLQAWRILELHTQLVGLQDLQTELLERLEPADAEAVSAASPGGDTAAYVDFVDGGPRVAL